MLAVVLVMLHRFHFRIKGPVLKEMGISFLVHPVRHFINLEKLFAKLY